MGNFFTDLFGSKKSETKPLMRLPGQHQAYEDILGAAKPGAIERLGRAGEAYGGELTAGLSDPERTGLNTLEDWLGSDLPSQDPLFGMARNEYEQTLGSDYYDPAEGQYYQAYRAAMQRELQEARDRLAATTSARDSYFGGGRIATEGEMEEDYMTQMSQMLGLLFERERERRLGAIPGALDLLGREEQYPLTRIGASQQYGALPREWEDLGLQREYGEYLRQLQDLGIPLETALMLATYKPDYQTQQSGGQFWDLLQPLSQLGGGGGGITGSGGGGFQGLSSLQSGVSGLFGGGGGVYAGAPGLMPGSAAANFPASAFGAGAGGAGGGGLIGGLGSMAGGAIGGLGSLAGGAASGIGSGIAGLIGLLSDIRFKENIIPIENSLEKVKQLDGKTYNYTQTPHIRNGGIVAQDLEKVMPEGVVEFEGVKYIKMDAVMGLLVNAVKELDEKIEGISA